MAALSPEVRPAVRLRHLPPSTNRVRAVAVYMTSLHDLFCM
jgi:hypothetical protein